MNVWQEKRKEWLRSDAGREHKDIVLRHLETIRAPIQWMGIQEPLLDDIRGDLEEMHGGDFTANWTFLVPESPYKTAKELTVARLTNLCLAEADNRLLTVQASELNGGSVRFLFNDKAEMTAIAGTSLMQHGQLETESGERMWAGVALPKPDFGLTCLLREIPDVVPPYSESKVAGFEWFIQGLRPEKATALSALEL